MTTLLEKTTAQEVAAALAKERRRAGSVALGMVLTLVVVTDERGHPGAVAAGAEAGMQHPCRVIAVVPRAPSSRARLDAEVSVGGAAGSGEQVVLRMFGDLADHADSVVLPLLLPDAPVVVWWTGETPDLAADSALGRLGHRRVTDAAGQPSPVAALALRARHYRPGDTDLAWTRLTPWRAVLAAALDEPFDEVLSAEVAAPRTNPSAPLLAAWLTDRLGVPVRLRTSRGPGITAARLVGAHSEIALTRPDGERATLSRTGQPDRGVGLKRRTVSDLLAEELRRLDPDEIYAATLQALDRVGSGR